jgi:hypothetical protein
MRNITKLTHACSVAALIVASLASSLANAAIRYQQSGDWSAFTPDNTSNGWQSTAVPTNDDTGRINWGGNTVTVTDTQTIGRLQVAVDEAGKLVIANGGNLTAVTGSVALGVDAGRITVGNNGGAVPLGTLEVQSGGVIASQDLFWIGQGTTGVTNVSGTMNVGKHLYIGWDDGITGTLNINNGGVVNVSGAFGLDNNNAGATGLVNVNDGGILNLANVTPSNINNDSLITLSGTGTIVIPGSNDTTDINTLIDNGYLVAAGGTLDVFFDGTDTYVTVIPEPSAFALIGASLALGIAVVRRRKR